MNLAPASIECLIGQRLKPIGHFNKTVTIEDVHLPSVDYKLRIRPSSSVLDKTILSADVVQALLCQLQKVANPHHLLVEAVGIHLTFDHAPNSYKPIHLTTGVISLWMSLKPSKMLFPQRTLRRR